MTVPQAAYSMAKLPDLFHVDPLKFKRVAAVRRPGLQVLHLSLTPGQRVPRHNHPGYEVMLHCLAGQLTLDLADERLTLEAVTFYLLNASLVVRFIAKPAWRYSGAGGWHRLLVLSGVFQLAAILTFAWAMQARVVTADGVHRRRLVRENGRA